MQNLRRKYPHLIKRQDVDAIVHDKWGEKYLQVQRKVSCRCFGLKKSICGSEYQGIADTPVAKRASAEANIKAVQIYQHPKEHLQRRINRGYRYIRYQKSKSPHFSSYFNHDTPQSKKRLCNPANWSRACPAKLSRSA